jgi:hypothetical protein
VESDGEIREDLEAEGGDSEMLVLAVLWRLGSTELGTLAIDRSSRDHRERDQLSFFTLLHLFRDLHTRVVALTGACREGVLTHQNLTPQTSGFSWAPSWNISGSRPPGMA